MFAHFSQGRPCLRRASVPGCFSVPEPRIAALQLAGSIRDLSTKSLFRLGKVGFLRAEGLPASFRDPMSLLAMTTARSGVGNVNVDQRLSLSLYLLYTVGTRQRLGLLGSVEQPLLSGVFGERDRLRARREHTATNHPKRTQVTWSQRRSSTERRSRGRSRTQREVSAARDHVRYGSQELPSSRLRPRPTRPGEEKA